MDIKSAFLNGEIQEKFYVKQHPSFINPKKPDHVYKLHRAIMVLSKVLDLGINA